MERRLSAILAADMVGYSRLMEADEIGTLERQKVYRAELIDPKLKEFHGRIVKEMGDGLLVEFPSVVEAVQCAVIIQQGMEDRENDTPDNLRIQYRIGINLGDIVIEGDDIFGDGVNIAARLEQMAEPGGICISGTAFDHLKSKVEVGYKSLGDVNVKNIKQAVRAYRVLTDPDQVGTVIEKQKSLAISYRLLAVVAVLLLVILSGGGWWWSQQPDVISAKPNLATLKLPDKPSIAVLPFANMSNDAEQEYFVDGMTDDLIIRLANVNSLFVIARNSVFTYKGKNVKVQNIGRDLGVRYVVEGSVRRAGGKIRINAQLIDAKTGGHLWAEIFDRDANEIFALQDEVTTKIVEALKITLTPEEQTKLAKKPTGNLEAYEIYLQARELHLQFDYTGKGLKKAFDLYQEAVTLDPTFADAYAHNAELAVIVWRLSMTNVLPRETALNSARQSVANALKIDPDNSTAFWVNALVLSTIGEHEEAIINARLAVSLNHGDVTARRALAFVLAVANKTENAKKELELATRADPNPDGLNLYRAGWTYFHTRQYAKALSYFKRAAKLNPNSLWASYGLAVNTAKLGQRDEMKKAMDNIRKYAPRHNWRVTLLSNGNLQSDVLKHYIDAYKLAGFPEWPLGFIGEEANQLTAEEVKKLLFGHRAEGSTATKDAYDHTFDKEGHWSFRIPKFNIVSKGQTYLIDGKTCNLNRGMVKGLDDCFYVYRNPKGTREDRNKYKAVNAYDVYSFSIVD